AVLEQILDASEDRVADLDAQLVRDVHRIHIRGYEQQYGCDHDRGCRPGSVPLAPAQTRPATQATLAIPTCRLDEVADRTADQALRGARLAFSGNGAPDSAAIQAGPGQHGQECRRNEALSTELDGDRGVANVAQAVVGDTCCEQIDVQHCP